MSKSMKETVGVEEFREGLIDLFMEHMTKNDYYYLQRRKLVELAVENFSLRLESGYVPRCLIERVDKIG